MAEWLNKWQRWFREPSSRLIATPPSNPAFWNLNHAEPLIWDAAELDLLRDCERNTTLCSITQHSTGVTLQTVILGFERGTQRILLDEFFPTSQTVLFGQRFQLNLPSRAGILVMEVV